jgi:poly(hydroxyalkanoate) depolymerase family esterase
MMVYLPARQVTAGRPLVVLLHGCGQNAADFATHSGWIAVADRLGIPLVLPEQASVNNRGRCFQWFHPADTTREQGEAGAIAAMTRNAIGRFGSDQRRVFVAGLSAGGAMAAALLAAYPDLYAAGAVVAGLPVGAATSALQGLLRMAGPGPERPPSVWADRVRRMAPADYAGPWPIVSIWHGEADATVVPDNAELLATQWRALHGLSAPPTRDETLPGARHRRWDDAVELWTLTGMPHGYPIAAGPGRPTPFMIGCSLPATPRIAAFWGLT